MGRGGVERMWGNMAFQAQLQSVLVPQPNGNVEFSWINARYNGKSILAEVHALEGNTCVFEAFCSGAAMAVQKDAASNHKTSDIRFNVRSLVMDYESHTSRTLAKESNSQLPSDLREKTVIQLFQKNGVLASSASWEGEQRIKLTRYLHSRLPQFDKIADFIRVEASHFVLFVGYGFEGGSSGKPYLIFLNSHGVEFGDNGFGRIYFDVIYRNSFYVLTAVAPPVVPKECGTSTSAAKFPDEDPDDRPTQRRRLNTGRDN
ncbi:uncharacterized protein LOC120662848 [Panicum virgatum]|uniref:uncharacterized protein LOC120662848 n=1 Tax=Panicum virgatum TaxID=38727 RepID=UPI0019D55C9F|nr:uncharacterized protein LOC120662848 [Panicum virgatum]